MEERKLKISQEEIAKFMEGRDPQERIVNLSYSYKNDFISVFYRDEQDRKCVKDEPFFPFLWATFDACDKLCGGNRHEVQKLMNKCGIGVKRLSNTNSNGEVRHEFDNGYLFLFYAKNKMSYSDFLRFFKWAGNPVYSDKKDDDKSLVNRDKNRQYLTVTPQEQFLISTGKRFFKGYTDYDQLLRMAFDLETEGLDPKRHRLKLNGVRLNRPVTINGKTYKNWGKIFKISGKTEEEKNKSELEVIDLFLKLIYTFKPDIITAHNGENFDWNFIIVRCEMLGTSIEEMSKKYFHGESIHKETRESTLKLGGEVEKFYRTIVPDTTVTDSMHAVRRAQATNSSIKRADLKYISGFLGIKKDNRVYTPGQDIDKILMDTVNKYAFNDTDGDWYLYDETLPDSKETEFKKGKVGDKPFVMYKRNYLADGYEIVTGEYIINRYLLDDIWECDRVEYSYNGTDFMLAKIIPEPFSKCTTMGTAGQWKAIMLAWSYENDLAIPLAANTGAFTGGLSRLLRVGYVRDVVKLDYNSLYPSIILTWGISDDTDLMQAMLHMLEYVLTNREKYKKLKKAAENIVDEYEKQLTHGIQLLKEQLAEYEVAKNDYKVNDNNQAVVKKLGNSFFGSYGSNNGAVFPWKSKKCAEQTTCTGRQCLRLMISHFHDLGYEPIVGDSFTGDTPMFIKYKSTGYIDIKPISEMINEQDIKIDLLNREYDYSEKPYYVLSRSGWVNPSYIYRHKTNKTIYNVTDGSSSIDVTEDHSLFDSYGQKIKPTEITSATKLEYYTGKISYKVMDVNFDDNIIIEFAKQLADGTIDRVPYPVLNGDIHVKMLFYKTFIKHQSNAIKYSKTCIAGIQFIVRKQ